MKLHQFQYMLECMERDVATLLVEKRGMTNSSSSRCVV